MNKFITSALVAAVLATVTLAKPTQDESAVSPEALLIDEIIDLQVKENIVYRMTHNELLAVGIDLNGEKTDTIAISFKGEGVTRAIENATKGKWTSESTLSFIGSKTSGSDSLYLAANTYQLSLDKKLVVQSDGIVPVTTKELVFEANNRYTYGSPSDDPFYDAYFYTVNTGSSAFARTFDLPSVTNASAEITVYISALTTERDHQIQVSVNGTEVANITSYGRKDWPIKITIDDTSILNEGSNEIRLTATGQAAGYDMYLYDKMIFSYDDGQAVASSLPVMTLSDKVEESSIAPKKGTNYVIISHPMFMNAMLNAYIAQRQSEGWSIQLVNVEDIYAVYGHGMETPDAIKNYLNLAVTKGVSHVQLVGASNYDYHDYAGLGSVSFIPSMYVFTNPTMNYTPSDTSYVTDVNGIPQMAIGRWPVRTLEGLEAVVNKTLAWKSSGQSASHTALLIAGQDEARSTYAIQMETLAQNLEATGVWNSISRVYLDEVIKEHNDETATAVTAARAEIIQALNDGQSILSYSGHSSPSHWSYDGVLTERDIAESVQNNERTTIALPLACYSTYVESPSVNTMAHQLLAAGEHGAVAIYGAQLFSTYIKNGVVASQMIEYLLAGKTIGEAVLQTKQTLDDTYSDEILGSSLLGDVTLRLR